MQACAGGDLWAMSQLRIGPGQGLDKVGGVTWWASSWWGHGEKLAFLIVVLLVQAGRNAVELLTAPLARVPVFKA